MKKTASSGAKKQAISHEKKVHFELLAPDAREVCLAGSFNGWDFLGCPMKKDRNGIWEKTLSLKPGRYEYRFLVDNQWENDPLCPDVVPNGLGSQNNLKLVDCE